MELVLILAVASLIGGVAEIYGRKKDDEAEGIYKHWWEY